MKMKDRAKKGIEQAVARIAKKSASVEALAPHITHINEEPNPPALLGRIG